MHGVGRREVGGGERGDMKQITAHSNPYSSFSLSFFSLCIQQGFDEKIPHVAVQNTLHENNLPSEFIDKNKKIRPPYLSFKSEKSTIFRQRRPIKKFLLLGHDEPALYGANILRRPP